MQIKSNYGLGSLTLLTISALKMLGKSFFSFFLFFFVACIEVVDPFRTLHYAVTLLSQHSTYCRNATNAGILFFFHKCF